MAAYEDPVFVKALKLLHSPAQDSPLQIRHLLEEVIKQKYGGSKSLNMKFHTISEDSSTSPRAKGSRGASPAFQGHSEKSSRSSTPPSEPVSLRNSPDRDDEELTLSIFEDALCSVCKGVGFKSDNRLLECIDCLMLCHQGCHKPPVDNDSWDQELGWTCGSCTKKSQEKQLKPKASDSSKHKTDSDSHSESSSKKHKIEPDSSIAEPPPKKHKTDSEKTEKGHKKNDKSHSSKSHGSKSSSSTRSESKSSKSSSSSLNFNKAPGSPNGKTPSCTANIIAADRRIQNMKKKAAAKILEKRSNPK